MTNLTHSRLDTETLPEGERFERFRQALNATHESFRLPGDARPFHARLDAWLIDGMVVTAGAQSASRIVRPAERSAADGFDHFTFMLIRAGSVAGDAGGPITAGAGQIAVFDVARAMDVTTTDNRNIGVRLPRHMLTANVVPDLHGRVVEGIPAALLADHFASIVRHGPIAPIDDAPLIVRATAAAVNSCLAGLQPGIRPLADDRLAAIRGRAMQHVDEHLSTPGLDPAAIARALGISRSVLYRAFADRGGIAGHIRKRRLDAIHLLLRDADERRSIGELAFAHGFVSEPHFSTAFRRRFGVSPRAVRSAGSAAMVGGPASREPTLADAYDAWLTGLCRAGG